MTKIAAFGPAHGFGAYIHWPYCARICPYCDFNVYAAKDRDPAPLLDAICQDIRLHKASLSDHPPLSSIYLGGGTPSLLSGPEIGRLIAACAETFGLAPAAEVTLEANPNTISPDMAAAWIDAGVNRLSVGVQSLSDDALAFLGRDHNADAAVTAVEMARAAFSSVSIDLIYARPGQSIEGWSAELRAALALGAQHVSLYELTIEAATPFGKAVARGSLVPMPDEAQADLYDLTQDLLEAAGYPAYEISNHARSPAHQSVHNLTYWRSGDWLGIGPGAHGRLTHGGHRFATEAPRNPRAYIDATTRNETLLGRQKALRPMDIAREALFMGLRTIEGVALARLDDIQPGAIDRDVLRQLVDGDYLADAPGHLVLTPQGRLLADRIAADLLA